MRVFLFILLFVGSVTAQEGEVQVDRLTRFGGLNTIDIQPPKGSATIAHETDLSRGKVGTVAKRRGFDKVDSLTTIDGIVHLEALQFDDGSKYMMVIGKDPDSGWGRIYVSNEGSENFEQDSLTEIYTRFPVTGDISVSKLRDLFYVTNGVGRGVVIGYIASAFVVRPFPLMAPGEPLIVPIDTGSTSSGGFMIDGTVRYVFKLGRGFAQARYADLSYISAPVKLNNGRTYITAWQWMPPDTGSTKDTTIVDFYRTKSDVGALDAGDSAFYTGQFLYVGDPATFSTNVWIDSLPDDSLGAGVPLLDENFSGLDENSAGFDRRYGAPAYVNRTPWVEGDTSATQPGQNIGVYWGWLNNTSDEFTDSLAAKTSARTAQGVAYTCSYIDTLTRVQSDTGRSFFIIHDQDTIVKSYTLSLPRPPEIFDDIAINLYRAPIEVVTHETNDRCGKLTWFGTAQQAAHVEYYCTGDSLQALIAIFGYPNFIEYEEPSRYKSRVAVDTVFTGEYKLVAQITDTSTQYVDSLRFDSLNTHPPYRETLVPAFMYPTFSYNGRLYGADGSNLHRSDHDNPAAWGLFEFVQVDPGFDEIVAAWPGQFALRVLKALSNHNVSALEFIQSEIVGRWGCIAAKSVALSPAGPIYLSDAGVVLEKDGEFLERTIVPGIISNTLINFNDMDPLVRKDARGMWLSREQQYWLSIGDTTYIWDWQATKQLGENVWTTSSVTFAGGTLYDVDDEFAVVPGRSFYFWREGDNRIFRYGQGITFPELDFDAEDDVAGDYTQIVPIYRMSPLLWGSERSQITGYGLLVNFDGAVADSNETISIVAYNELGTQLAVINIGQLHRRFIKAGAGPVTPALFYQIELRGFGLGVLALKSGTAIEALDIYFKPNNERIDYTQ
jgi:hypothetical protein